MSRPRSSVPNQCPGDGPWSRSRITTAIGSVLASTGASAAIAKRRAKSVRPAMALGEDAKRPARTSHRRCTREVAGRRGTLGVADTRIEPRIQHIHDEVAREVGDRDEQHGPLDHREVAHEDRLHRELPETRPAEDRLDDERAAEEAAELQPDERDDRDERVLEGVADDHGALAQALRPGGAQIIL